LLVTFSRESGVSMAKAIRMTWDFAYERGRSPWKMGSRAKLLWNLSSRLDGYLVFFLAAGSEIGSAGLVSQR
jgi:hypothetical protein